MKQLVLENISISFRDRQNFLICHLDLVVEPGEIVTVMGKSGIGKSTLLAFIGGHLDKAFHAEGRVLIGKRIISGLAPEARKVGILFQDDLLFPHLSVGDNLAFGLSPDVRGAKERRLFVEKALKDADLAGFADRDPATLSGGQRARVALMRTLMAGPEVLLLDEPFSKLDNGLRDDFRRFVFSHAQSRQLPILMVTHDEEDAKAAGGRILSLQSDAKM